eukprot:7156314-Lingulodinium_polyedra.AAC.1
MKGNAWQSKAMKGNAWQSRAMKGNERQRVTDQVLQVILFFSPTHRTPTMQVILFCTRRVQIESGPPGGAIKRLRRGGSARRPRPLS